MKTKRQKMFKAGLVISIVASMFLFLSACATNLKKNEPDKLAGNDTTDQPASNDTTDQSAGNDTTAQPATSNDQNGKSVSKDQNGKTADQNQNGKSVSKDQNEKTANQDKNGGKTTDQNKNGKSISKDQNGKLAGKDQTKPPAIQSQKCESIPIGNKSFITTVIKKLRQDWQVFSKCQTIQSATVKNRAYRLKFSEEAVTISKLQKYEQEKELVSLDWRYIRPKFLVVLQMATEMAEEQIRGNPGSDALSVFEWSFPATPIQKSEEIPGTVQIQEKGYPGLWYQTIHKDEIYWTTKQELEIAKKPVDLIVYKPYDQNLSSLARFFSLKY